MSRRRHLVALPLALMVSALVACTDVPRIPPPEPPASSEPLFASDEEALEAATAAYEEYLAVSGAVTSQSELSATGVEPFVTSDYLGEFDLALDQLRENGLRTEGLSRLARAELQQYFEDSAGVTIVIYVCLDVSGVRVLNEDGQDLTPPDRSTLVDLEISLSSAPEEPEKLLLASSESWEAGAVCDR